MSTNYDDIIDIDYEKIKSKRHPQMSRISRAAQFAPFAALTGHDEAIEKMGNEHLADEIERIEYVEES